MAQGDTLLNAFVGALVTVVLSFVPLSPALGGAVAGYLQGPDTGDGVRVGAISGAVASLPMMGLLVAFGGLLLAVLPFAVPTPEVALLSVVGIVLLGLVFVSVVAYTAVLSALGGYLGAYVRREDLL